eukprot:evm.model.scf_1625.2 EVM.evm.TU.scf_1625.2   scf_1625:30458-31291(-)
MLSLAIVSRDAGRAIDLIEKGADVNAVGGINQLPPLWDAIVTNSVPVAEALLDAGADIDYRDPFDGATTLIFAIRLRSPAVARLLIARGANTDLTDIDGKSALYFASKSGPEDIVVALLEAGADPEIADRKGVTPLIAAATKGKANIVEALLGNGADPTRAAKNGATALHQTSLRLGVDAKRMASLLLEAGADGEGHAKGGLTPLMFAAGYGNVGVARVLLYEGGVDVDAKSGKGKTAADLVCECEERGQKLFAKCPKGACARGGAAELRNIFKRLS